ncbi:hypothetical protein J3R08_001737 [Micromonospora sp. HB375]|uniref:hypothetical protein n=1 Tax=unclassified Micromonospora TaxID=2617518 RepID=UPI001AE6C2C7|nr:MULTISPECIES: hypothetical protein [unclassified Micromonospora]MBP1781887.1 hypothetical protein [Micromonospora sp. HB375]
MPLLLLALVASCADRNPAEEAIYGSADVLSREVEGVPAFHRGQLGTAGVSYLRGGIERSGDEVLDSEISSGEETAGQVLGWIDARFTRQAQGGFLAKEDFTATLCLRFEVRHDSTGGSVSYHEKPCP